ncbi:MULTISPECIES: hypothetical protein [unclassified Microcoleus]|uniref:hypothetical protein n=1 Tax=unclassified Microcoleus TaxID=2642155 RepID=UPI001D21EB97|nr:MULTISPECIES: hypothetical protein [unclassified Microcoleus]TAE07831.1 MAG: hypothetical protein EAZ94_27295 [Oscillatoriales cyanobacterium]MCC3415215.1 hypothetical protein [Microcoleus sp. PH2017_02_FOX_O_A]MCC3519273.1 hypothetical protein [Microcoleus sp. PH2017_18_LLB_O_A]MCC3581798.1 hypothetical protein [Microcoleus sp. PH2017_32_RDM_D_A]MCC3593846.1 hypothetical protein [Microcoleus sp. PH2017_28_MFU_U_A]
MFNNNYRILCFLGTAGKTGDICRSFGIRANAVGGHETETIRPYTLRLKLLFAISIIQYWGHRNFNFFNPIIVPGNQSFLPDFQVRSNFSSATDRSRVKSKTRVGIDRLTAKFQKHELKTQRKKVGGRRVSHPASRFESRKT